MARMRIVRWVVQPIVMADDDENLTEISVQPLVIPHAKWPEFTTVGWKEAVDQLRQQIEQPDPA